MPVDSKVVCYSFCPNQQTADMSVDWITFFLCFNPMSFCSVDINVSCWDFILLLISYEWIKTDLISLRFQSYKHVLVFSFQIVSSLCILICKICTLTAFASYKMNEKCRKWNSIHSGRYLESGAKAFESIHARRRCYKTEEGTPDWVQSLLQITVCLWQKLGMLFKFPLSQFLCLSLQNQLRSWEKNQFLYVLSSLLLLLWGQNSLTRED